MQKYCDMNGCINLAKPKHKCIRCNKHYCDPKCMQKDWTEKHRSECDLPIKIPKQMGACCRTNCDNKSKHFCSKCNVERYCSKECQKHCWYIEGHKTVCGLIEPKSDPTIEPKSAPTIDEKRDTFAIVSKIGSSFKILGVVDDITFDAINALTTEDFNQLYREVGPFTNEKLGKYLLNIGIADVSHGEIQLLKEKISPAYYKDCNLAIISHLLTPLSKSQQYDISHRLDALICNTCNVKLLTCRCFKTKDDVIAQVLSGPINQLEQFSYDKKCAKLSKKLEPFKK